jgi:hypothetical protein
MSRENTFPFAGSRDSSVTSSPVLVLGGGEILIEYSSLGDLDRILAVMRMCRP